MVLTPINTIKWWLLETPTSTTTLIPIPKNEFGRIVLINIKWVWAYSLN